MNDINLAEGDVEWLRSVLANAVFEAAKQALPNADVSRPTNKTTVVRRGGATFEITVRRERWRNRR